MFKIWNKQGIVKDRWQSLKLDANIQDAEIQVTKCITKNLLLVLKASFPGSQTPEESPQIYVWPAILKTVNFGYSKVAYQMRKIW